MDRDKPCPYIEQLIHSAAELQSKGFTFSLVNGGAVIPEGCNQESRGGGMYGFPLTLVPACWKRVTCGNDKIGQTLNIASLFDDWSRTPVK